MYTINVTNMKMFYLYISHIEAIKACIIGNKLNEGNNIINTINNSIERYLVKHQMHKIYSMK